MKDESKLILCGFIDLFSVSAFITTLPSHIRSYDVSTTFIGLFFSLYGALQIVSSYVMGYLADKRDKKVVLCICTAFSAIGYLVLGMAPSFLWMFFLRIITGLFKQTQTISRTILTAKDVSNETKVTILGRFSTLSTIGFIFGPPIGGYIHEKFGFFYVGCLSSFGFVTMLILFLSMKNENIGRNVIETTCLESSSPAKRRDKDESIKGTKHIVSKAKSYDEVDGALPLISKTWDILTSIFLLSFCPLIFRTNYSITLKELFESTGTSSGFVTSFGAVTGSIAGIVVPYVLILYRSYYRSGSSNVMKSKDVTTRAEAMLLLHTSLILGFSILGCGLAPSLLIFVLCQSPVSFVNNLSREAFNVIISNRVLKGQVGRVMGMNGSLIAFGRLVAPVIGGFMQEFSYRMPAYCGSLCTFLASAIIYKYFLSDYHSLRVD